MMTDSHSHKNDTSNAQPRWWFWVITLLTLLNAVLGFGYYFLGWNPATDAAVDAPAVVIAANTIQVSRAAPLAAAAPAAAPERAGACLIWGAFGTAQASALSTKAVTAGIPQAIQMATPSTASHIILMGPYPNRAALDKKISELKRMKVPDMAVTDHLSISLGLFSNEAAAHNELKNLGKLGVRSAKVLRKDTVVSKASLRFEALSESHSTLLKALATDLGVLSPC